jgi:hypothetical protein
MEAAVLLEAHWDDMCDEVPTRGVLEGFSRGTRGGARGYSRGCSRVLEGYSRRTGMTCVTRCRPIRSAALQTDAQHATCNIRSVQHGQRAPCTRNIPHGTCDSIRCTAGRCNVPRAACAVSAPTGVDREHRATASAAAADGAEQPRRSRGECSDRLTGATWRVACCVGYVA